MHTAANLLNYIVNTFEAKLNELSYFPTCIVAYVMSIIDSSTTIKHTHLYIIFTQVAPSKQKSGFVRIPSAERERPACRSSSTGLSVPRAKWETISQQSKVFVSSS